MNMNIEKALNRLNWRFSNKTISPNETDQEVVKFFNDWICRQKAMTLKKNILFAKLFCYCFKNEIQFYRNPKFAQRKIFEEMEFPISFHYASVLSKLNDIEYFNFLEQKGFPNKHPSTFNDDDLEIEKKLTEEHKNEIAELLNGKWDFDSVSKSLNNTITELMNRFPNEI